MRLTTEQILQNSFAVTIDGERFAQLEQAFQKENLIVPHKFVGYSALDTFLINQFQSLKRLEIKNNTSFLKQELKIFYAIFNNVSHWTIVQMAKFADMPFVTIFEDDAVPVENLKEKLDDLCSDIPDETDVLRLGYCPQFERALGQAIIDNAIPHSNNLIVKNLSGSHAYIVFKRYYDRFIEDNKKQPRCSFKKINPTLDKNVFALKESLFNQVNLKEHKVMTSWKLPNGEIIVNN